MYIQIGHLIVFRMVTIGMYAFVKAQHVFCHNYVTDNVGKK
jgi:hypothetical protein